MTVADLAKQDGVSERTIRRRLNKLDVAAGGKLVLRNTPGNNRSPIYVTVASLEKADKRLLDVKKIEADRVVQLESAVAELKRRLLQVSSSLRQAREVIAGLIAIVESRTCKVKRGRNSPRA